MEVRLENLWPHEIEQVLATCTLLYLPLGMIEWHGYHNVVGLDSLKAHALCVRAAEAGGGLVHPPIYGGVGGMELEHTFVYDDEEIHSDFLRPWLERTLREAKRNGFRAVIMLTGHYGPGQQITVRETAVRMSALLGIPVLGTPEYLLAQDEEYWGDHAAWGETSLMMHLAPWSVRLDRLDAGPHRGVGGRDPRTDANAADGERLASAIVRRLAKLGPRMPLWDRATCARFVEAESALVERQKALALECDNIWGGWRNITKGVLGPYGQLLADERFEEIKALAANL